MNQTTATAPAAGPDGVPRIAVSADIDTPDTIAWGLSFRQLAILASAAGAVWAAHDRFGPALPPPVWIGVAIVVLAVGVTVALGRRDGLPLDVWVRHGLTLRTTPRLLAPGSAGTGRALLATPARPKVPAPLRPEATGIAVDGALTVDGATRTVIACGTTSIGLRTPGEQTSLLEGFGRWLNALTGPVQIVVSAARHDLTVQAAAVVDAAARLPHPALRAAALDHARFLLDLDATREPLRRQVLAVVAGPARETSVRGLTALGITATALDGPAVAAALAAAVDPYDPPVPGPRATPGVPITARRTR
jgi:PrgI family protein